MRILNLFADADGESHFREIVLNAPTRHPGVSSYPNGFRYSHAGNM